MPRGSGRCDEGFVVGGVRLSAFGRLGRVSDGPKAKAREAVQIFFSDEVIRAHDVGLFKVLDLKTLVRVTLTEHRCKDRVHIRDLIEVGLIDGTWPALFEPLLATRLQALLDTPEG